jgi:hypothetical protein
LGWAGLNDLFYFVVRQAELVAALVMFLSAEIPAEGMADLLHETEYSLVAGVNLLLPASSGFQKGSPGRTKPH